MIYCSALFGSGKVQESADNHLQSNRIHAIEISFDPFRYFGFSTIFIDEGFSPDKILTDEEFKSVISEAKTLGAEKITFSGKEASAYTSIKGLISFAKSLGMETSLVRDDYLCLAASGKNDPPFCMRHRFSCVVTSYGYVLPCPGLEIPLGNVRGQKLADIIKDSEIIADLKDDVNRIKGPCRVCENIRGCCGCRGRAYIATGDYLASDPVCIKNKGIENKTQSLPLSVENIIPQKPPMRIIDTLDRLAERSAYCSALIKKEMPFINDDLSVDNVAYLEMIAQSIAALNGFRNI
jgi:hypothetical protein